ncbi:DoxX family protein [Aeromonas taiwanensis]|uniref:DoxX family protein n=1 Tax=Aeromonas taiwanensis TaxID=633417 RepID=A0A5F0K2V9_9GAMM|nr:DoxX family protein [Aeromonas taiwanensis]TFF70435.1 DoxX family protein [Aeromonas taiwanensis]TFF71139.1 DoxX family protein [Aeromonas taiwanensis]TFF73488.1 DoxX family protein [Aeromonas taiwanensis]
MTEFPSHPAPQWAARLPCWGSAAVLLLARLWVATVFLRSGWLKLGSWDSTLYLFEFEYRVPLLPWQWAAYVGTATELLLPLFLLAGLFTRPVALLLFGFNIMAVISYPTLWAGGFYDHQLWGWMLLTLVVWGAGPLALDRWRLARRSSPA